MAIAADLAKDKFYAVAKQQKNDIFNQQQSKDVVKQAANPATGLQWAMQQTVSPQAVQKSAAVPNTYELSVPNIEDTAMLSSSVSLSEESATTAFDKVVTNMSKLGLNTSALEQSFKEIYKKSKSHNMLLERFMSSMKLGGITMLMGLCGIDPENIDQIKAEAREEALKEIDTKLSQDWAYTKSMLDITGA